MLSWYSDIYMPLIPIVLIIGVVVIAGFVFFMLPSRQSPEPPAPSAATTVTDVALPLTPSLERRIEDVVLLQTNTYRNGTYTTHASYYTPKRQKHVISVTLSLQDDVITAADVQYDSAAAKTPSHTRFDGAYESLVLGVEMDDLDLSRVGGASLTTTAFNETLADIASDASL